MIPNHIKIGNSATYLNKYIIDHNYSKICILVDDNTVNNCLKIIKNDLKFSYEVFQIQSGEEIVLGLPFGISCGLAGGNWKIILAMIEDIFHNSIVKVLIVELINKRHLHETRNLITEFN